MSNYKHCVNEKSTIELVEGIKENWNNLHNADFSNLTDEQVNSSETILAYAQCIKDRGLDLSNLSLIAYRAYKNCLENY